MCNNTIYQKQFFADKFRMIFGKTCITQPTGLDLDKL